MLTYTEIFTKLAVILGSFAVILMIVPIIGVLFGMLAGWIVGGFFPSVTVFIHTVIPATATFELWQIGGGLGFVGAFFKSNLTTSKD